MGLRKITIKDEWLTIINTLPKTMQVEILGAVTLYLVSGEQFVVSKKSKPFLDSILAMINLFKEKSEKMRSNRLGKGICYNKCKTIDTSNDNQMINNCSSIDNTKEERDNLPPTTPNVEKEENNLKEKTPKGVKEKVPKRKFAENVSLTEAEYDKLVVKYGLDGTLWMIDKLNAYKTQNEAKYKSDYGAINNWVVERYQDFRKKQQQQTKVFQDSQKPSAMDIYFEAARKIQNGESL